MKNLLFVMALSSLCWAQTPSPQPATPTTAAPAAAAPAPAKTIFDYQSQLGLSDKQVAAMKTELANLNTSVRRSKEQINTLEGEYRTLLGKNAAIDQCKAKLQQIANATTSMRVNDLQASRRITGTLTAAQLVKWREIQTQMRAQK